MEILVSPTPPAPAIANTRGSLSHSAAIRKRNLTPRSKLNHQNDSLYQAAIERASLRFQETLRPDPLFVDPYAGCLVPTNKFIEVDVTPRLPLYCLATKFIDDKLLNALGDDDDLRQVVLFTDGMDTRPYRLNWPRSTLVFDISPQRVFGETTLKLKEVGARIGRSCMFIHIPCESANIEEMMRNRGFKGARPSIWVFQGLPLVNLARFKEILSVISNLATKGSVLLGELPSWLSAVDAGIKSTKTQWMDNLFMSNGLRVNIIGYENVARDFEKELEKGDDNHILFTAEQLRFSDEQMETWSREFQRIEEEADEEGFEEL
ncbi:O-methyltransferase 1, chloroplastic-like isoform X1 [Coffea arabica]|uniref:O-methyltransferase 1, chloroplastic-like isoform X1 n=1 Tax=Coffea arabica TaxID=13443 RepID=A0A6P6WQY6_COFAR|nr:uncharacterized protein LOC113735099 isoform X1 [Coffea arabica]